MEEIKDILARTMAACMTNQNYSTKEPEEYSCPKCKDKEVILEVVDGIATAYMCDCAKANQYKRLYQQSGIAEAFAGYTFKNYVTEDKPKVIRNAYELAVNYCKTFDSHHGLALLGRPGSGKTHLCISISNYLLKKNFGVLYMQYREAITQIKQNMTDEEFYQREVNRYKKAPILYIDDLFKGLMKNGKVNDTDIGIMFEIVNHRYMKKMPILVSSEYGIDSLLKIDEALGSRIIEMCKGYIIEFEGSELNHRLQG